MRLFIEEIYKFYESPKNQAEFQEWKKAKTSSRKSEIDFDISTMRSGCNEHTIEVQKRCGKLG